ncbi:TPA: accessory Sec system translocase SecA2 [Streptococcus suis]|nr:accessory Sec system translocase SecA2 [Streptococcus suis]HEM5489556.1 accessory Sec system translocase SecA2 [Streptococcus suis]
MKVKTNSSFLNQVRLFKIKRIAKKILQLETQYHELSDEELANQTVHFKERLEQGETLDDLLIEAFATVREASYRILGQLPYEVQVMGGIALHQGCIAEMRTGEGKTLTATMPLYLNALTGKGAILVTTNDYLATRDGEEMGKIYQFLGLTVGLGAKEEDENTEDKKGRASVYEADITYTTSSILGFDYLSHNLASSPEGKILRDFNYVIVDEADAVLLDSAQTPLIISGSPRVQSNLFDICNQFILTLKEEEEFYFDSDKKEVYLTEKGNDYAESYFDIKDLYTSESWELNRHINLALRAHYLYRKNFDYVVQDDEVKLLDNRTGRVLEGTRLQSGIHQAIETKEKVKKTKESRAMGSVTYQSLFNMFPKIAGMTGTGHQAEDELIETYHVPVISIPTNKPIQRIDYPDKIYTTLPEKLYATIEMVKELHEKGQPVLLVSGTVEITQIYSKMLLQEGIPHSTLTANNVAKEALIIQEAGQYGTVTCATIMAGRGTDIKLGKGVAELGGLAVIGTERMPNSRMDWQLRGRAGRQGEPGMSQFFVSLEDELLVSNGPDWVKKYFKKHNHENRNNYGQPLKSGRFNRALTHAQTKSEDGAISSRRFTIEYDESMRIQRNKVYALRDRLMMEQENLAEKVKTIVKVVIEDYLQEYPDRTSSQVRRYILDNYTYSLKTMPDGFSAKKDQHVKNLLYTLYEKEMAKKASTVQTQEGMLEFYRLAVLKAIDEAWIEEVDSLQQLKGVITTRSTAQKGSVSEYYKESLRSYKEMTRQIQQKIVRNIMLSTIEVDKEGRFSIYFV